MEKYCKVVIIDDELITRQGLKHIIVWEKEGFQIVGEASNGHEGLELIDKLQPDIVLADIVMPVMDGMDFSLVLQEKYPRIQLIILSSYDDFDYVKSTLLNGAIDYVLKPTLSPQILLAVLHKAAKNIPGLNLNKGTDLSAGQQMARYLAGYQETLDECIVREKLPYRQFRILAIDLKKACDNNRKQMERITEWLGTGFRDKKDRTVISAVVNEEVCCCLFNYRRTEEERLLQEIKNNIHTIFHMEERVFFVIGNSFSDLDQMRNKYEEGILPRLKRRFYYPGRYYIFESECETEETVRFDYEKYSEKLRDRQYADAMLQLETYMEYVCQRQMDEYILKNLMKNLLYNLLIEVEKYGISGDDLREKYFRGIDSCQYVNEFLDFIHGILGELNVIVDGKINSEDEVIARIRQYISQHYAEELELAQISRTFSFNYHYLSSYFNQHIPEGFSGYLNKVRIEKACSMLEAGKMPIAEIGAAVGYTDHSYFSRVFKKTTGLTPSRYRKNFRQE